MQYKEYHTNLKLTEHIECYWDLCPNDNAILDSIGFFPPDCTYDIIISDRPFEYMLSDNQVWKKSDSKVLLFGLHTCGKRFRGVKNQRIFGIRIKLFAIYPWLKIPLNRLNNNCVDLENAFDLNPSHRSLINKITQETDGNKRSLLCDEFLLKREERSLEIDQSLRSKINYILDRKGVIRIQDMYEEFCVSKHSLQRLFQKKIGLNPKMISRIWRLNYFLELKRKNPLSSMTSLGIESGYYDQAHLIKDVKFFFNQHPLQFFEQNKYTIPLSQDIIERRFNNNYDPIKA